MSEDKGQWMRDLLGHTTVEDPAHVWPASDPFHHTGEDDCPCGPTLKKIQWEELTYWAMVHHALVPEEAYRLHYPEEGPDE